jgi:hypothetical protein
MSAIRSELQGSGLTAESVVGYLSAELRPLRTDVGRPMLADAPGEAV